MRKYGLALGCFFLGCVTSQVSSVFTVPKALASQPDRFEYFCFGYEKQGADIDARAKIAETRLKKAGEEGWELVSVVSMYNLEATYCLKRRLP